MVKRKGGGRTSLVLISLALGVAGFLVILFTEVGQLLNLPSSWLYAVYPHLGVISLVLVLVSLLILITDRFRDGSRTRLMFVGVVLVTGMVLVTNYFVPYVWLRGHHHTAEFIAVGEADQYLQDEDDVFVLVVNDDARAYPKDWMMIPHIAGDTVGGEEVVMTYCVLTNLPMPFDSFVDGEQANLKVVSQAHNNLVMTDTNSGELYQQITATAPVSGQKLAPQAGQRMPWRSFKVIYPDGHVFRVVEKAPWAWLDRITYALFVAGLEGHYNGPKPLFPTLRMDDDRLPPKEQIWGVNINGEQVAFTRSFLEANPVHNTQVGGEPVLIAFFDEFDTVGVFRRTQEGKAIEVESIDVYGKTPQGRLDRLPQYPHVFWMVWSHWFPDTAVNS